MGRDDSSPQPQRRRENLEMREQTVTSVQIERDRGHGKKKGCFARNKKAIIGITVGVVLLGVLFMILGLTGVFDATPDQSNTTTASASTLTSVTVPQTTVVTNVTVLQTTAVPQTTVVTNVTVPQTTAVPEATTVKPVIPVPDPTVPIPANAKIECLPDRVNITKEECFARGCSFSGPETETPGSNNVPRCYVNSDVSGYRLTKLPPLLGAKPGTEVYNLTKVHQTALYSVPFVAPQLRFERKSGSILNFKFFDSARQRYEVPVPLEKIPAENINQPLYTVHQTGTRDTDIQIIRNSTGTVLWDMSLGGLYLEDQFLQITTKLPSTYVYGFGDNRHNSLRHKMDWKTWPMFSRDAPPTNPNKEDNLYGVHPFYICIEEDGNAHGVFLLNSNAMDYKFQPAPGLTLRSIGGIFDFYIFMGPTPEDVVQQYTQLLGRAFMPPYWGLGFQISRWGFRDLEHVKQVVDRNVEAGVPLDAVYGDIDYMDHRQDFTIDKENYGNLSEYVKELHDRHMQYVIILDPAIHVDSATKHPEDPPYKAYLEGVKNDIFIKWPARFIGLVHNDSVGENRAMLGKVWPDGRSAFPDFFKNETLQWWEDMIKEVYTVQNITFDALWIDMNEVSSFDTNEDPRTAWYCNKPDQLPGNHTCFGLACPKDDLLENPPYKPMAVRNWVTSTRPEPMLSDKTLCMVAETTINGKTYSQYDVHSLYGWSQAEVTFQVAQDVRNERSFAFSRSTYPGSQKFVGHWFGDNAANFADLRQSIVSLMEYSMFGFSYIGADICGFFDDSSVDLCKRWSVVGAFYPFARNHNHNNGAEQDPASNPIVADAAKRALLIRYTLLPYLYTLFYRTHIFGDTVTRPLYHVYPQDVPSRDIDDQFFWGPALMISPIVDNVTERSVYIPSEHFYDYYDGSVVNGTVQFVWDSPNLVPLHLRPGFIIPTQDPATTTFASRQNKFRLLISSDLRHLIAKGELFWDDGKSIDTYQQGKYYRSEFTYNYIQEKLTYTVLHSDGVDMSQHRIAELRFYSRDEPYANKTVQVLLDGVVDDSFTVSANGSILSVKGDLPMDRNFTVTIRYPTATTIDCTPEGSTQAQCEARGCLWVGSDIKPGQAQCAFSRVNKIGYINSVENSTPGQLEVTLTANPAATIHRPNAYSELRLVVREYSANVLRITISGTKDDDPAGNYTVPCNLAPFSCQDPAGPVVNPEYSYYLEEADESGVTSLVVERVSTGTRLWNTAAGALIYANQFRELTTHVPSTYVYGVGENTHNSFRHDFNYKSWGMFARDQPPGGPENLYGVHPYVQVVEDAEGHAFGAVLVNSNAMEMIFSPLPAITYRTIGGQLDFFLFVGDSPSHVNRLYMGMIGKPFLPPYWALGFQLSRYGYDTFENMSAAVERTLSAEIPLDIFYGDIDYFEAERNFEISQARFGKLPAYVDQKLTDGLRFVTILDPCVAAWTNTSTFERGLNKSNAFIRWPEGYVDTNSQSYSSINSSHPSYLLGHVWPAAKSVFVDFFHPEGRQFWEDEVRIFRDTIKFSALWIDMNEPASFGTNNVDVWYTYSPVHPWSLNCTGDLTNSLENPPYIPRSLATRGAGISDKTICMTAVQSDGTNQYSHYNVHSLYGHSQIAPSLKIMEELTGKRSFVFSRSTFIGSGTKAGHWLGDNSANWDQLRQSVIGMLEFNLFGIPYVGADICGFFNNAEAELCTRWMQLGAFYPFSRNHNGKGNIDQDPLALGPFVAQASKKAVDRRYTLLPYLYSLFYQANQAGSTVVRSLMEVYPKDLIARSIDKQFMWGDALLITPVLEKGATNVTAYFPEGEWYTFETGVKLAGVANSSQVLPVDIMSIPLHVRGGHIIPMQQSATNTKASSKTPYSLWVASDSNHPEVTKEYHTANGALFWDGGEVLRDGPEPVKDCIVAFVYALVEDPKDESTNTTRRKGVLTIVVSNPGRIAMPPLDKILIAGYPAGVPGPIRVQLLVQGAVSNQIINPQFDEERRVVSLEDLKIDFNSNATSIFELDFWNYEEDIL